MNLHSRLWRCIDYALIGIVHNIQTIALSFINNGSDIIRVVQRESDNHSVIDLGQPQSYNPSSTSSNNPLVRMRSFPLEDVTIIEQCQFSGDGQTLMITIPDEVDMRIYKFGLHGMALEKFHGMPDAHRYAVLSDNGQSLLATFVQSDFVASDITNAVVHVWPRIHRSFQQEPLKIEGDRAIWGDKGEYALVWNSYKTCPRLLIYTTSDLLNHPEPIAERILNPGLANWKAWMPSKDWVLICEIYKSGKARFLVWAPHTDTNIMPYEVCVTMPKERTVESSLLMYKDVPLDSCLECALPVQNYQSFLRLAIEDAQPSFGVIVDNPIWMGTFSWHHHSFVISSVFCGSTVFSCTLPDDVMMSPMDMPITTVFDPKCHHVLLMGDGGIYAFAPPFLIKEIAHQRRTTTVPTDRLLNACKEDAALRDGFRLFSGNALAEALNWQKKENLGSGCAGTSSESSRNTIHAALSSDGQCCVQMTSKHLKDETVDSVTLVDNRQRSRRREAVSRSIKLTEGFRPEWVFMYPNDHGRDDGIVFFSSSPRLMVVFYSLSGQSMETMPLNMETCLNVHPSGDRCKLLLLDRDAVHILSLQRRQMQTIPYRLDFVVIFGKLNTSGCRWMEVHHEDHVHSREMISDDGRIVVLGWDTNNNKSLTVTPTTTSESVQSQMTAAVDGLSEFCRLNRDGSCTLFVDVKALQAGNLIIGIFSEQGQRVTHTICIAHRLQTAALEQSDLCRLLSCVFYKLCPDAAEVIVATIPMKELDRHGCHLDPAISHISIYGTEDCVPDYDRFMSSFNGNITEALNRLYLKFKSGGIFNLWHAKGQSMFQAAFLAGNRDMVRATMDLAKQRGFELILEWKSREGYQQNLKSTLSAEATNHFKDVIHCITSRVYPFRNVAAMIAYSTQEALKETPETIIHAFVEDLAVVELCQLRVHAGYLNPTLRRDQAIHIGTLNEVHDLELEKDPEMMGLHWRATHPSVVKELEKNGNRSTSMASLKAVCIRYAARTGSAGLIRHLLLRRVPEFVFKCPAVKWVIEYKWFKIWKKRFLKDAAVYVAFLAAFSAYAGLIGTSDQLSTMNMKKKISSSCILVVVTGFSLVMSKEEITQLVTFTKEGYAYFNNPRWGVRYFFSSRWNWVDVASCILLLLMPVFHGLALLEKENNNDEHHYYDHVLSAIVGIEAILAYIKVWYFVQPFRVSGALVLMIDNIFKDCFAFLALAFVVLVGFALALHVLYRDVAQRSSPNEDVADAYGTFRGSLLTLFYALLGDFDSQIYREEHVFTWLIIPIFAFYMIGQMIVLLNLLIAIMGDSFDKVKSNEEASMLVGRAQFIDASEAALTEEERNKMDQEIDKYVYALESVEGDDEADSSQIWMGRLNMLEQSFKNILARSEARIRGILTRGIQEVENGVMALRDWVTNQENRIAERQEQRMIVIERRQVSSIDRIDTRIEELGTRMEENINAINRRLDTLLARAEQDTLLAQAEHQEET